MNVRRAALGLLLKWEEEKTYLNISVAAAGEGLCDEDRAFLTALIYGTAERRLTLDYLIGALAERSALDLKPITRNLLRMGLYQVLYMQGIPVFAAVHETVALARDRGEKSLVNAILREADRRRNDLPLPKKEKNAARYLSVLYSMPLWITKRFLSDFGEDAEELLAFCNSRPALTVAVNTSKISREDYLALLRRAEIHAAPTAHSDLGIRVMASIPPARLPGFDEGLCWVQDEASQLAVMALAPRPGETVLDLCACPGGKSFAAAVRMEDRGRVCSFDLKGSKMSLLVQGAERLGLSAVTGRVQDATVLMEEWIDRADRVICDVPCSGLGVLAKKPDLRYREEEGVLTLPLLQYAILENAARYVRDGGVLVYSTCTLNRAENQEVAARFAAEHPDFYPENVSVGDLHTTGGMLTLLPHIHGTDGFFFCRFRRRRNQEEREA